ncbi:MAG: protein kinase [Acidobacteriota bacterium]|nr:MAG: protein kinase [Acidobacteriota bacterium]
MTIQPGQRLLHYRLIDKIGEGGMGEVWRASDETLGRDVAIKILPTALAAEGDRLARFEREARTLATLNHPNIAAIYGLHEADGVHFLVMELVHGEDLAERLKRGPLESPSALEVADQLAAALEYAHEQGVIHRDLKPANVKRAPDGTIKVLDFGLAKAIAPEAASGEPHSLSASPTATSAGTMAGTILGTAAYMSPEQARGRPVDRRSDVWAFGCLLYEMLTGRAAFEGETVTDILASVVRSEPEWSRVPAAVPQGVVAVLRRCLRKDARERLRDMGDARLLIKEAAASGPAGIDASAVETSSPAYSSNDFGGAGGPAHAESGPGRVHASLPDAARSRPTHPGAASTTTSRSLRGGLLTTALAAALILGGLLGAVGAAKLLDRKPVQQSLPSTRFTIVHPASARASIASPVASPDGRFIVYVAREDNVSRLWLRELAEASPRPLAGTEGASLPFISPDSRWIGFFAENRLRKVAVSGGTPIDVCDATSNPGAAWGPDDTIVFSLGWTGGLLEVAADGGESRPLTSLDDEIGGTGHWWPEFLPGGRALLFTVFPEEGTLNRGRIALLDLDTGKSRVVGDGAQALYLPTGHILYHRAGIYELAPFDAGRGEIDGAPVQVFEDAPPIDPAGTTIRYLSVSPAGVLAWIARDDALAAAPRSWFMIDRAGHLERARVPPEALSHISFSPDGGRVLATHIVAGDYDVFMHELATGASTRLTRESINNNARWHPDGRQVAFDTIRLGTYDVFTTRLDEASPPAPLVTLPGDVFGGVFSADGRLMAVQVSSKETGEDVHLLHLETGALSELVATDSDEEDPAISPDGRLVAFVSDRSGVPEIYVVPVSGPAAPVQISRAGGNDPQWSRDGAWLAYNDSREVRTAAVRLEAGRVSSQSPRPFVTEGASAEFASRFTGEFAVATNGQHVLVALYDTPIHAEVQVAVGPLGVRSERVPGKDSALRLD